jgi:hypothetical protein
MREPRTSEPWRSHELDRLVTEAELRLGQIDGLLAEIEAQIPAMESDAGRMCWRSEAAQRFDARHVGLRDRVSVAASTLAEGRHQLERQLRLLRVLADAARGALWAMN